MLPMLVMFLLLAVAAFCNGCGALAENGLLKRFWVAIFNGNNSNLQQLKLL